MGLVRMVRPWNEWLIVWGYDINEPAAGGRRGGRDRVVHNLVGDDTIDVDAAQSTSLWGNNKMYADALRRAAACSAWATPATGTRRATASARTRRSQDAYNLAWKLALVLRGQGGARRCWTPTTPSARRSASRSSLRANQSIEEFGPIFEALGLLDTDRPRADAGATWRRARRTRRQAPRQRREAARRRSSSRTTSSTRTASSSDQRYRSGAVVAGRHARAGVHARPRAATTTRRRGPARGCRTRWLEHDGRERSRTHDLAGKGRFTLLHRHRRRGAGSRPRRR